MNATMLSRFCSSHVSPPEVIGGGANAREAIPSEDVAEGALTHTRFCLEVLRLIAIVDFGCQNIAVSGMHDAEEQLQNFPSTGQDRHDDAGDFRVSNQSRDLWVPAPLGGRVVNARRLVRSDRCLDDRA